VSFPLPETGVVCVCWVDASQLSEEEAARTVVRLPADERERFHRYRHALAASQFLVGRLLIRQWLEALTGTPSSALKIIEGPRGRPALEASASPWSFNVAHSGGLVACAMSRLADVGVDLEHLDRRPMGHDLYRRYCAPAEIADIEQQPEDRRLVRFLTYWTLKEAYLKARGLGIAVHLADVEFSIEGPQPVIRFRDSLEGADPGWAFALFHPTDRFLLSVAAPQPAGTPSPTFEVQAIPLELLTR